MNASVNAPVQAANPVTLFVRYAGTDEVKEGEPFVYDVSNGTATDPSGRRHNQVKRPTASGEIFAGVAARAYPAGRGDRQIELCAPGSHGVRVRVAASVTRGDVLQFAYKATVGGKTFKAPGSAIALTAVGIGDAIARQTTAYSASDPATHLVQADLCVAPYKAGVAES